MIILLKLLWCYHHDLANKPTATHNAEVKLRIKLWLRVATITQLYFENRCINKKYLCNFFQRWSKWYDFDILLFYFYSQYFRQIKCKLPCKSLNMKGLICNNVTKGCSSSRVVSCQAHHLAHDCRAWYSIMQP